MPDSSPFTANTRSAGRSQRSRSSLANRLVGIVIVLAACFLAVFWLLPAGVASFQPSLGLFFSSPFQDDATQSTVDADAAMDAVAEPSFQIPDLPDYPRDTPLIGAWNLRLKGPPAFMRPGDYRDPLLIARFVLASGADLWAIQEIPIDYTTEEATPRNHYMDGITDALNRLDLEHAGDWQYAVVDSRDRRGQNPGFLWNAAAVRPLAQPRALEEINRTQFPETERRRWSRIPAYAPFAYLDEGIELLVFSVQQRGYDGEAIRNHRAAEVEALLDRLPALREETGITVTAVLGRLADHAFEPSKDVWAAAGFSDLNSEDVPNLMSGRGGPNDSINLFAATTRIIVARGEVDAFPHEQQTTLGDAWLNESEISLHNFLYYASNCLPVVTPVVPVPDSE